MAQRSSSITAALLLGLMLFLAGGAALRESASVDEVAHTGAGLSYLQRFDLRLNPEHPPLAKTLAALPLAIRGVHADYSSNAWRLAETFFGAYMCQWVFGDAVLGRWNDWRPVLLWARLPMLALTLLLGWVIYRCALRLGGLWGGLLCLALYVTTPAFLAFGPLVITDLPVVLFSLLALWQLGEVWASPSPRNSRLFGLAVGAALLSKFTGLLLILVVLAFLVQTRFRPSFNEPADKAERKAWRGVRRRSIFLGFLWAAVIVYVFYFVLSINQPDDALNKIGSGPWAAIIRRPLMPIWLYLRGLFLMLVMGSRPTFLLGHHYAHGIPFYFPVVFALKSTLGFLLLLLTGAALALLKKMRHLDVMVVPDSLRPHWRVLLVAFYVFLCVCLLSRLDISIRHFLMPITLLILMLAPLPNLIEITPHRRLVQVITAAFVASSFAACFNAYPYFFPFVNSLALGRPTYSLVNDSNVSWNESLPAVNAFVQKQGLTHIKLDWASLSDASLVVPGAEAWDCQTPEDGDTGSWVIVSAVSILENRNCGYLQGYRHEALAGGAIYAFQLPRSIPAYGQPGAPPRPSERMQMWQMPVDIRAFAIDVERHPEKLPKALQQTMRAFGERSAK